VEHYFVLFLKFSLYMLPSLMRLHSGHLTLLWGECQLLQFSPQLELWR